MPITLAKIANNTATVTFAISDQPEDTVTVVYYPGHITEKVFSTLQSFGQMNGENIMDGFEKFNAVLASLIKSWDVFEDDAQTVMFPIDAGRFVELPFRFRMQLVNTIMGDIRPETIAPQERTENS